MTTGDAALRADIVEACRLLYQRGLAAGFDGNSSARTDRGTMLVTPAGVHKGMLRWFELVEVDLATGAALDGKVPTSEAAMHLAVLRARPDARAVVHSHAPTAVALSLLDGAVALNGFLPELAIALGEVRTLPYAKPGTQALAEAVAAGLARSNAVIMARHGTVAVGSTVSEALARTEMIEHTARVVLTAHLAGTPQPIPREALELLWPR